MSWLCLYLGTKPEQRTCNILSIERYILHLQVLLECCYIYTWENRNHHFYRKGPFLIVANCHCRDVAYGMKQTQPYLYFNGIDAINKITKLRIIQCKDIIYITENEIRGQGQLLFVFLEKSLYEVNIIRINEQVDEKRSTVHTQRNADCLLENTNNKYVINKKILVHFNDISFRECFGRIRVVFYKIRCVPSWHKVFVTTLAILFS